MMGNLHEQLNVFMIISDWFLLKIRNVSDVFVEKIKSQILCSAPHLQTSESLWDKWKKYTALQVTNNIIRHMWITCWVPMATNTVTISILFFFTEQQILHKVSIVPYNKQSFFLWNEQENVLARLYALGETQQVRTATQSWNVWSDAAILI